MALALGAVLTCATGAAKGNDNVERLVALGKLWATIRTSTQDSTRRILNRGIRRC